MVYNQRDTLTFVIAGGRGSRLFKLTDSIPKPMIPFDGKYRLIDFVMSNLYHSELRKVYVLTQYNAQPLNEHINRFWENMMGRDGFATAMQPQETLEGKVWYEGTAHAIAQNISTIEKLMPKYVAIFGADHVYNMDVGDMLDKHVKGGFDLSISAVEVNREDAKGFGIFEVKPDGGFGSFAEKPEDPKTVPGKETSLASMGNYIFNTEALLEALKACVHIEKLDFGKHLIPYMIEKDKDKINIYNFSDNKVPGITDSEERYWRDVGTIRAYYDASMELTAPVPSLNLYNKRWRIFSDQGHPPPFRTTVGESGRQGTLTSSSACGEVIISGGSVHESVIGPDVRVYDRAEVLNSILFGDVTIGKNARVMYTIVADGVNIPEGFVVGENINYDKERGFIVDDSGIRVITNKMDLKSML